MEKGGGEVMWFVRLLYSSWVLIDVKGLIVCWFLVGGLRCVIL